MSTIALIESRADSMNLTFQGKPPQITIPCSLKSFGVKTLLRTFRKLFFFGYVLARSNTFFVVKCSLTAQGGNIKIAIIDCTVRRKKSSGHKLSVSLPENGHAVTSLPLYST